jgi:hypothetical protein
VPGVQIWGLSQPFTGLFETELPRRGEPYATRRGVIAEFVSSLRWNFDLQPMHAVGPEEVLDDAKRLLGIEPFRYGQGTHDVGEQDGDVLAFALQRGRT